MSKFFDETRKAQEGALAEGAAKGVDVQRMLEVVKGADAVATDVAASRLKRCRKIRLTRPADVPVLSAGDGFTDLAAESYGALRTRLLRVRATSGLRSVVISSALQGEGKTLTALNLGLSCARLQEMRVLVVDADLRTCGLTHLLGSPAGPGLGEVLEGKAQYEDAILATDVPNLYLLGAGTASVPPPELYSGSRWKEYIGWCSETFKVILVDAPPILPLVDFELIAAGCDGVLVVVRAHHTKREFLQKAADLVDAKKLLGAVFNATVLDSRAKYYHYFSGNHRGK